MLEKSWDYGKLRDGYDLGYIQWRKDNNMKSVNLTAGKVAATAVGAAAAGLLVANPRVAARVAVRSGKTTAMRECPHMSEDDDPLAAPFDVSGSSEF